MRLMWACGLQHMRLGKRTDVMMNGSAPARSTTCGCVGPPALLIRAHTGSLPARRPANVMFAGRADPRTWRHCGDRRSAKVGGPGGSSGRRPHCGAQGLPLMVPIRRCLLSKPVSSATSAMSAATSQPHSCAVRSSYASLVCICQGKRAPRRNFWASRGKRWCSGGALAALASGRVSVAALTALSGM